MSEKFIIPQRQSSLGIILIFSEKAYKFVKALGVYLAIIVFSSTGRKILPYSLWGISIFVVLGLVYSYFYYRKLLFHIDYEREEFVLVKGVFSTDKINIPFDKIQQVDLKRSILQRIIGVYSLKIDTAGSKDKEIEIKAISGEKARAISRILIYERDKKQADADDEIPIENQEETYTSDEVDQRLWTFKLSFLSLIKVGITRSYFRGFLLILAFAGSIYSQLQPYDSESYFNQIKPMAESELNLSTLTFIVVLILIIIVFLLSVLVTIGEVIVKHFNLKMEQTKTRLAIEMGLKTNTHVSFQPRRLQRLEVSTNPIQKWLNLYQLQFSLASSENDMDKSKIIVPGLSLAIVDRVKSFLYQETQTEGSLYKPHKAWMNRRIYALLFPLVLIWSFLLLSGHNFQLVYGVILSAVYFVLMTLYQWMIYKSIRLEISNDFLSVQKGWWTQKKDIIEIYKMEGVSVRQPFWYRRRKIYNLTFHTAGGDVMIRTISEEFLEEINFLLYKVETSQCAWM